jgi:hypothetical protein
MHPMHGLLSSRIMRTTVDIADPALEDVRRAQERQGKTLGQVVSKLLPGVLAARREAKEPREFRWVAKHLGTGIDLWDKDALWTALNREEGEQP